MERTVVAELSLARRIEPWTFEDLQRLPESPWRFEIVDGGLVMTPGPGLRHEVVSDNLRAVMRTALGGRWRILGPQNLDLDPSYLIPDLVVIREETARLDKTKLAVADVEVVVEIVSPGSRTHDRITKPAQYAAGGIPAYWRVETDGTVGLTAYVLAPGQLVYTEVGTWREGETAHLTHPTDLTVDIDELVP
ncbi:MAG: Uma2 family endonuclease [Actinomycetota bacterium]|nr:Uma2 family endonuclease [Actinomycetota bacterium]